MSIRSRCILLDPPKSARSGWAADWQTRCCYKRRSFSHRDRVAESTLRGWLRDYLASGFDALRPQPCSDFGLSRTLSAPLVESLAQIKAQQLTRPIRSIIDQAREEGFVELDQHVAVSSVHRLLQRMGLMTPDGVSASVKAQIIAAAI